METKQIMQSHLLDIIFENRNKSYGAYALRMGYEKRMLLALGIMITIVVMLSAFTFIGKDEEKMINTAKLETTLYTIKEQKKTEKKTVPQKPVNAPVKKNNPTQKFVSHVVVMNQKDSVTDRIRPLDSTQIASSTQRGDSTARPLVGTSVMPFVTLTGGGGPKINTTSPLNSAEIMPSFPGGIAALRAFMERNLTTPTDMGEDELVEVHVRFVVGFDGKLQSFEVVKDGGTAFNNEVVRVLKKMPDWVPGRSNGEKVSVYFTLPVKFVAAAP